MEVSQALDLSSLLTGTLPSSGLPAADAADSTRQPPSQFPVMLASRSDAGSQPGAYDPLYFPDIFQQLVSAPEDVLKPGLSYEIPRNLSPDILEDHSLQPVEVALPEVKSNTVDPLLPDIVDVHPTSTVVTDTIKKQWLAPVMTTSADSAVNMGMGEVNTVLPDEQVIPVELRTLSARLVASPVTTESQPSAESSKATNQVSVEFALNPKVDEAKNTDHDLKLPGLAVREKPTGHYETLLTESLSKRQFSVIEQHPNLNQVKELAGDKPVSYSAQIDTGILEESRPLNPITERQPEKFSMPSTMDMKLKDFQSFPSSMGERLAWLVNKEQRLAQIRLDPPELGRLQIALSVDGDQVSVQFHASGTAVKDLILQQVDRLRTAMAGHELNLVNVNVSTGGDSQSGAKYQLASTPSSVSSGQVDDNPSDAETLAETQGGSSGYGLLDTFA